MSWKWWILVRRYVLNSAVIKCRTRIGTNGKFVNCTLLFFYDASIDRISRNGEYPRNWNGRGRSQMGGGRNAISAAIRKFSMPFLPCHHSRLLSHHLFRRIKSLNIYSTLMFWIRKGEITTIMRVDTIQVITYSFIKESSLFHIV